MDDGRNEEMLHSLTTTQLILLYVLTAIHQTPRRRTQWTDIDCALKEGLRRAHQGMG